MGKSSTGGGNRRRKIRGRTSSNSSFVGLALSLRESVTAFLKAGDSETILRDKGVSDELEAGDVLLGDLDSRLCRGYGLY